MSSSGASGAAAAGGGEGGAPAALLARQREGVAAVFAQWTALRMAVENGWGGVNSRLKADALIDDVADMFVNAAHKAIQKRRAGGGLKTSLEEVEEREFGEVYNDQIEDLLFERLPADFNTQPEDGSVEEVSLLLSKIWRELQDNDGESPLLAGVLAASAAEESRQLAEQAEAAQRRLEREQRQREEQEQLGAAVDDGSDDDGWFEQKR